MLCVSVTGFECDIIVALLYDILTCDALYDKIISNCTGVKKIC